MGTDIQSARRGFVLASFSAVAIGATLLGALTPFWPIVVVLGGFGVVIGLFNAGLEIFD